jgi:hypothetical protein
MSVNEYEQRNKSRIHTRPILSLLIGLTFFTVILLITLAEAGKNVKSGAKPTITNPNNQEDKQGDLNNRKEISTVAIVLETDKTDRRIRLYDIDKNEEINLYYTGGTGILDKYGQAISINQVDMGRIVDISYQNQTNRLTRLQFSQRAWEYIGVNNMTIIPEEKTIKIAKNNYTYTEPFVVDIDRFISLEDLAEQDELTVRGIDEVIWSIIVTKGHGTVKIKDSDAFLGGSITVGYEAVTQITKDMVITVREGNYNLTVENGEYSGTKNITVERNKETVVSIGDLGPEPIKYGKTTFDITPFGADLYIDNELTNYASPVELAYGEHHIQVSLGGYSTYSGNLLVDYASKKIKIVLPELQSREPVSIVELDEQLYEDDTDSDYMEYNDWDNEQYDDNNPEYIDSLINEADYEEDPIVDSERLIYIQKPVGASVYLNGEFKGVSPGSFQKVIGSHVLTFIKKGYQTKSYTIDIADDGLDTYISLPDLIPEY